MSAPPVAPQGPPYALPTAQLGLIPTPLPDDAICAVLLLLFVASAVVNMTIFQINKRHEHKFVFSGLLFGFSMARISALTMRIVWASRPTNVSVLIAASVFTAAGVLLLFIVNLIFAQRIVRAYHPGFGWHKHVTMGFRFLLFSVIGLLIMVVTVTVHSFFTLDAGIHDKERKVQLFAGTYLALLAFLPIPIVIAAALFPRKTRVEKFGSGRFRTKVRLLLFTSTLLALGAGFRLGVNFAPRPLNDPAWYHSKPCYYCFNFVIELIVVYTYVIARFDRRFHVPNGASAPGDYSRVNRESEVFGTGDDNDPDLVAQQEQWANAAEHELKQEKLEPSGEESV